MPSEPAVILTLRRPDADDNLTEVGKVEVGEQGKLTLTESSPALQSALASIVEAVNAQESLRVKTAPSPEAAPGSIAWSTVRRDDPDFLEALTDYMEQKYNLRLGEPPAPPDLSEFSAADLE